MDLLGNDVPPLGMGCWPLGGRFFSGSEPYGFPDIDDDTALRIVHAALDAGLRLFDTAGVYGAGHAERLLGKALKGRDDVLIVSKLGMGFDEETRQVLNDRTDAADVAEAIDDSLRRLQRDCVDIMLLHLNSLPAAAAAPVFDAMEQARRAGKIRAYGWSTDLPGSVSAMAGMPGFVAVEHAMNVFVDAPTMQATVERLDLAALIRSPLAMGLLGGKYDASTAVPGNDVRSVNNERRDYFRDGKAAPHHLATLAAVRDLLQTQGRSLAQGALGWLLAKSGRNIPIPGARSVGQVKENAGALAFGPLPDAVMREIEQLVVREPEGAPRPR